MGVMRSNKGALRSVLEAFVHDPLVEWRRAAERGSKKRGGGLRAKKKRDRGRAGGGSEAQNPAAKRVLACIADRLNGKYNIGQSRDEAAAAAEEEEAPLSVEGQVHRLIHEATDDENLAEMYIGWMVRAPRRPLLPRAPACSRRGFSR